MKCELIISWSFPNELFLKTDDEIYDEIYI